MSIFIDRTLSHFHQALLPNKGWENQSNFDIICRWVYIICSCNFKMLKHANNLKKYKHCPKFTIDSKMHDVCWWYKFKSVTNKEIKDKCTPLQNMSPFPINVGWMLSEMHNGMGTCFVKVVCNFNSNHASLTIYNSSSYTTNILDLGN
jgi:hypothetical protein